MKLVIQIPCFNEEATLTDVLTDLPQAIPGIDDIEVLVIDDGSTDRTADIAVANGADRVVSSARNEGLARAFAKGLETALEMGADVIVNTDGDHQYQGKDIPRIVEPILEGRADLVVGDRGVEGIPHFSRIKKRLQQLGSAVVRLTSGTSVADATSGFRALSRSAALRIMIYTSYTYTLETIIQAGKKGLAVESVPINTNEVTRESRLIEGTASYVLRSAWTILRIFLMYEPLRVFGAISLAPLLFCAVLFTRYAYYVSIGQGMGHVQSVIVASGSGLLAFQIALLGLLADLIARNRRIAEELVYLVKATKSLQSESRGRDG